MTDDVRTDDDIARLFADANPVPTVRPGVNGQTSGRVSSGDVQRIVVPLDRSDGSSRRVPNRLQWFLSGAVAAVIVLAVVLGAIVAERGELNIGVADDADPADTVEDRNIATLMSFFAALNAGDAAGVESLLGPDAAIAVSPLSPLEGIDRGVTVADQVAWLVAWDMRFDDITCGVTEERSTAVSARLGYDLDIGDRGPGVDVPIEHAIEFDTAAVCSLRQGSRLGDLDDATTWADAAVKMLDGRITFITANPRHDWAPAFRPFVEWAESEHPELWRSAWDNRGPLLNPASIAIEDQLLTEYIQLRSADEGDG